MVRMMMTMIMMMMFMHRGYRIKCDTGYLPAYEENTTVTMHNDEQQIISCFYINYTVILRKTLAIHTAEVI